MYNPKTEVYSLLKTLGYDVVQPSTNEFTTFPTLTYTITNDAAHLQMPYLVSLILLLVYLLEIGIKHGRG